MNDLHMVKRVREQAAQRQTDTALRERDSQGNWSDISWQQFGQQIDEVSLALLAYGLKVQENVGIFSNNMAQANWRSYFETPTIPYWCHSFGPSARRFQCTVFYAERGGESRERSQSV